MAVKESETLVLLTQQNGIVVIPTATPLTRLNYFDGKFLRASDLKTEQDYLRQLVRQSNQAGGAGVVHGFDLTLGGGDTLNLGAGLAINRDGGVLLLPQDVSIPIQELIDKSQELQKFFKQGHVTATEDFEECEMASATPPVITTRPNDLYLIVICGAEALCGEENVYGKLCEEVCATSSDRPYAIEGLIVRAVPLVLQTPLQRSRFLPISTKRHLRSSVAAAYFEDERQHVASMISRLGLEQEIWCLGAEGANGACLPIGVIARAGATTVFLDAWIARRERIDTPPRRYWQWRMMMRPWDVFLAQILQFQCQFRDLFGGELTPDGEDPCGDARSVIGEAAQKIVDLIEAHRGMTPQPVTADGVSQSEVFNAKMLALGEMGQRLTATQQQMPVPTGDRLLLRGGIIELPSAGYLPVRPDARASVNQQVRQLMGEGVELRFCVVRPDFVAHSLEEAQHMERISLIEGLDDPQKKPQVDILVPNGEFLHVETSERFGFAVNAVLLEDISSAENPESNRATTEPSVLFKGVARLETLPTGGAAVYLNCISVGISTPIALRAAGGLNNAAATASSIGLWLSLRSDQNLLLLQPGDKSNVSGEYLLDTSTGVIDRPRGEMRGVFTAGLPEPTWSVSGTAAMSFSLGGEAASAGNLDFSLVARWAGNGIEIHLRSKSVTFNINADWSAPDNVKTAVGSRAILRSTGALTELRLVSNLTRDESVFSPADANHVLAVQALELLAGAIKDPSFVNQKSSLLFPPDQGGRDGGAIHATRDWVLFHRRRNKQCEVEVQPPPAIRSVCHTVYRAPTLDRFKGAVTSIKSMIDAGGGNINDVIVRHDLFNLGDVLFEEHSARVFGDGQTLNDVVTGWNVGGGIVSVGAAFSQLSSEDSQSRKDQVDAIVQKINKNGAGFVLDTFTIPASIALPTSCPAFSIIAGREAATPAPATPAPATPAPATPAPARPAVSLTCVRVIRVLEPTNIDFIGKEISAGRTGVIDHALEEQFGPILGTVLFKTGTTEVANNSLAPLQSQISALNLGSSVAVEALVVANSTATAADREAFQKQTAFLRETFGGKPDSPVLRTATLPAQVECPALVFMSITSFKP